MSAQRFTVERIEAARECIAKLRDSARTGVVIEFRQRDPLVLELHRALDAFALQTRQVEQMREFMDGYRSGRAVDAAKMCGTCAEWGEGGGESANGLKYCGRNLGNAFFAHESCSRWTDGSPKDGGQ